jgi:hypothetical protein
LVSRRVFEKRVCSSSLITRWRTVSAPATIAPPGTATSLTHEAWVWRVSKTFGKLPWITSRSRPSPSARRLAHQSVKFVDEVRRAPAIAWSLRSSPGPESKWARARDPNASNCRVSPCHRRCAARTLKKAFSYGSRSGL